MCAIGDPQRPAARASPPDLRGARVLVVSTTGRTVDAFLVPQLQALLRAGSSVLVATGGEVAPSELPEGVEFFATSLTRRSRAMTDHLAALKEFRSLIRQWEPQVLYVHTPIAAAICRLAIALLPARDRPSVLYLAHGFHFLAPAERDASQWIWYGLERLLSRFTDKLLVINEADFESVGQWPIAKRGDVHLVSAGVGIDHDHYSLERMKVEGEVSVLPDRGARKVVCVAEFTANKRQALLVQSIPFLPPDVQIVFVGDGPLLPRVARLAVDLGVDHRTTFLGHVPDVRPMIAGSGAAVLVSRREGLPRSLMEAACLGVPVVTTRTRGAVDIAIRAQGYVASEDAPRAIADAIVRALKEGRSPGEVRQAFLDAYPDSHPDNVAKAALEVMHSMARPRR